MFLLDPSDRFFVLSENLHMRIVSYGVGNLETIEHEKFNSEYCKFRIDQIVQIRRIFQLNKKDIVLACFKNVTNHKRQLSKSTGVYLVQYFYPVRLISQ